MLRIILLLTILLPTFSTAQQQTTFNKATVIDFLQQQQYEEAATYIRTNAAPNHPATLSLLGYTYTLAAKPDQAINTYQQALQIDSTLLQPHLQLAAIYMQQEKATLAIPHYYQLIRLQPTKATHYRQLSFAFAASRQPDSAFTYIRTAYTLNPNDPKVVARLAEEYVDRKQYTSADSVTTLYLPSDSMNAFVIVPAIKSAYFQKHYQQTIQLGKRLMQQNLTAPAAMMYVAAACFNSAQYTACIGVNDYMTNLQAPSEGIMYYAALAYNRLKDYEKSNELLLRCITFAKSKSLEEYYAAMAGNFEALKQYKQAAANYDTSYYLSHNPIRQYSLGRLYDAKMNNKTTATRYYKKYLQLAKPNDEEEKAIFKYVREMISQ